MPRLSQWNSAGIIPAVVGTGDGDAVMPLKIDVAVVKTNKYASRESGDTVEIVERPGGGISVIMADGQGSGRAAKTLSLLVTAKVSALLKEGVRDGASARAANDFLFAMRNGQVSATLDILSVDLNTGTVVITRNSDTACYVRTADGSRGERRRGAAAWHLSTHAPLGGRDSHRSRSARYPGQRRHHELRPAYWSAAARSETIAAKRRCGGIRRGNRGPGARRGHCPRWNKPTDDMSVVALTLPKHDQTTLVRRMGAEVPLP